MMRLFKNPPLGLTIAVGVSLIILLGLGTWQMQRLGWKRDLLAELERTLVLPPMAVDTLIDGQNAWRQVSLPPCDIAPDRLVYMHGVVNGVSGYHLLTYCPGASGNLLVDLGFSAAKPAVSVADVAITGRLRPFEAHNGFTPTNDVANNDWYSRDVADLSQHWGVAVREDYFIAANAPVSPEVRPVDVTANLPNRHLEYALTWYALAAALVGVYIAVLYQRARKEPA